jgi:rhodanese-related sulfurtransferase
MTAAKMLSDAGFSEIYNLEGGIGGWTREGFVTVK